MQYCESSAGNDCDIMEVQEARQRGTKLFTHLNSFLANTAQMQLTRGMSVLDFGCGKGGVLHAFLKRKFDAFGIDCDLSEREYYAALAPDPAALARWVYYDGAIVPFEAGTFDLVYSWFVLEHIANLKLSLKEMARVVKPGGVIALFTQDARSAYDGHVHIPWPPFMHVDFYEAYLEEWGKVDKLEYMKNSVYYVTSDEILCVLRYFGMEIVFASNPVQFSPTVSLNIRNNDDARKAAAYLKQMQEIGKWKMPTEQISILARKPA